MKVAAPCLFLFLLITSPFKIWGQTPARTIPDFTFFKLDGTAFTRNQLAGNGKIMFVFFDVTCGHCQQEAEELGQNYREFKTANLYMISLDEPVAIKKFMDNYGKNLKDKKNVTLLQDKNREFIYKFSPTKYPAIFIYSPQGNLIQYFGGETRIKEIIKAIK